MKEYIQMMKAIWDSWQDGSAADFIGKAIPLHPDDPNFNPGPIELPAKDLPRGGGPAMARVAGEVADGVLPHGGIMTDRYMRETLLPNVKIGLERSGRTWDDIDIAASGYLASARTTRKISQSSGTLRHPLSFYGSTRSYHHVLRHARARRPRAAAARAVAGGRWQEMQQAITDDDLLALAETCKHDDYPEFVAANREYASQMGFGMETKTDEQKARARELMRELQAVNTPGVPAGMAF